jgi:hypothetical protein
MQSRESHKSHQEHRGCQSRNDEAQFQPAWIYMILKVYCLYLTFKIGVVGFLRTQLVQMNVILVIRNGGRRGMFVDHDPICLVSENSDGTSSAKCLRTGNVDVAICKLVRRWNVDVSNQGAGDEHLKILPVLGTPKEWDGCIYMSIAPQT